MQLPFIKWRWILILILLVGNVFVWLSIFQLQVGRLRVSFLDVGQGDAIVVLSPTGRTVLIDGGPGRNILRQLSKTLPLFNKSVDLIIETHPDTDHVAGLPDVLSRYQVRGVLKPCIGSDNPYDVALDTMAHQNDIPKICAQSGQRIDLGGGAAIEILYAGTGKRSDTNGASVVARLMYGNTTFLFSGDATAKEEKYLEIMMPEKLRADVYKVSHHGSRESNDIGFLKDIHPSLSVVSVGKGNRYGHPHQEVLNLLSNAKSAILRTDQEGTISLWSDGKNIWRR